MKHYLVIFILVLTYHVHAQDALFNHFSKENGLPSNQIYAVIEDEYGRMWFSGKTGLMVLEGFDFRNVPLERKDDFLVGFQKAPNNELWSYSTDGRLYNLKEGSFREIALNEQMTKRVSAKMTNCIAIDNQK